MIYVHNQSRKRFVPMYLLILISSNNIRTNYCWVTAAMHNVLQGLLWLCTQPVRGGVTMQHLFLLAEDLPMYKLILILSNNIKDKIYWVTAILLIMMYSVLSRDHSGYGLHQWEEALLCNAFSHWLSPYPEWSLAVLPVYTCCICPWWCHWALLV